MPSSVKVADSVPFRCRLNFARKYGVHLFRCGILPKDSSQPSILKALSAPLLTLPAANSILIVPVDPGDR